MTVMYMYSVFTRVMMVPYHKITAGKIPQRILVDSKLSSINRKKHKKKSLLILNDAAKRYWITCANKSRRKISNYDIQYNNLPINEEKLNVSHKVEIETTLCSRTYVCCVDQWESSSILRGSSKSAAVLPCKDKRTQISNSCRNHMIHSPAQRRYHFLLRTIRKQSPFSSSIPSILYAFLVSYSFLTASLYSAIWL